MSLKKQPLKTVVTFSTALLGLSACHSMDALVYVPKQTAATWCAIQPCVNLGNWVISQPSSSIIVYFLGVFSILVGLHFLRLQAGQQTHWWWGISIVLGGIGALLAGTSYQAFGYELKCAGRVECVWTNWWEVSYNMVTVAGAGALLIAIGYSSMTKAWRKIATVYAILNMIAYLIIALIGAFMPNKFLVSFEMMILFTLPAYLLIFAFNSWQYFKNRDTMTLVLLGAWLLLFATLGVYYWYMLQGFTQQLWQSGEGIWFSENDVLHVGMIAWIAYVWLVVAKWVKDK